jgi:hypothetical protein
MMGFPVRVIAISEMLCRRGGLLRPVRIAARRLIILDGLQAFCIVAALARLQLRGEKKRVRLQ